MKFCKKKSLNPITECQLAVLENSHMIANTGYQCSVPPIHIQIYIYIYKQKH